MTQILKLLSCGWKIKRFAISKLKIELHWEIFKIAIGKLQPKMWDNVNIITIFTNHCILTSIPITNIIYSIMNLRKTSTTPSCSGLLPAQKSIIIIQCNSVPGVTFPHTLLKMNFYYSHRFIRKNTLNWYITCHGYNNNQQSPFIGVKKLIDFFNNPLLDNGGSEIKFTYYHRNFKKEIS